MEKLKKLDAALDELEEVRVDHFSKYEKKRLYYILPILLAIFALYHFFLNESTGLGVFFIFLTVLAYSYAQGVIAEQRFLYNNYYKDNIVRIFAKHVNPTIFFEHKRFVFNQLTQPSGLLDNIEDTNGEDYFKGKTKNGYPFQFSELKVLGQAEYKGPYFDGLFFIMDSPKIAYEKILISPKASGGVSLGNSILSKLVSFWKDVEVVDLRGVHPKFEAEYRILSKKKEDAEELLTEPLLETIYQLAKKWKVKIKLSFVDKRVYLALPTKHDFFETKLEETVLTNNLAKRLYHELSECFEVMETLSVQLEELPEQGDLIRLKDPNQNWNDSAYDHFLDDGE